MSNTRIEISQQVADLKKHIENLCNVNKESRLNSTIEREIKLNRNEAFRLIDAYVRVGKPEELTKDLEILLSLLKESSTENVTAYINHLKAKKHSNRYMTLHNTLLVSIIAITTLSVVAVVLSFIIATGAPIGMIVGFSIYGAFGGLVVGGIGAAIAHLEMNPGKEKFIAYRRLQSNISSIVSDLKDVAATAHPAGLFTPKSSPTIKVDTNAPAVAFPKSI